MLLLAITQRIGQYGITERRYLLFVLAVWLGATALFYAVSRSREIKGIPLSLAVLGLLTFVGPWSAYDVSQRSQVGRLEGLLTEHGVLREGRVSPAAAEVPVEVPAEDWRQINDILHYLAGWHGTAGIDGWFEGGVATVDTIGDGTAPSSWAEAGRRAALIADYFGLAPGEGLLPDPRGFTGISPPGGRDAAVALSGFDRAFFDVNLLNGPTHARGGYAGVRRHGGQPRHEDPSRRDGVYDRLLRGADRPGVTVGHLDRARDASNCRPTHCTLISRGRASRSASRSRPCASG